MSQPYTSEEIQRYIDRDDASACPGCGSDNLEVLPDSWDCEGPSAWHEIQCCSCGEHYREVFILARITPVEPFEKDRHASEEETSKEEKACHEKEKGRQEVNVKAQELA